MLPNLFNKLDQSSNYKKTLMAPFLIFVLWVLLRIPSLSHIYHQDEYKWATLLSNGPLSLIPHPPLVSFFFQTYGNLFGYENLRSLVLFASAILFWIQYALLSSLFTRILALGFIFLSAINPYSVIMSTQVDIDGTFLPLVQTLYIVAMRSYIVQHRLRNAFLVVIVTFVGPMTKLSFILLPITFFLSTILFSDMKKYRLLAFSSLGISGFVSLIVSQLFDFASTYVGNFLDFNLATRSWSQVFFLSSKVLLLIGPIILCFFSPKSLKMLPIQISMLFIIVHITWYVIIFDFSTRALDRYLESLVYPSLLIGSIFLVKQLVVLRSSRNLLAFLLSISLLSTWFINFDFGLASLQPKSDFIKRFFHLDWNFLFPFFTASGPLGFFVPFSFLILSFLLGILFLLLSSFKTCQMYSLRLFAHLVVVYSVLTSFEHTSGLYFGNSTKVTRQAILTISDNASVITYNDTGAFELREKDLYLDRLYLRPDWYAQAQNRMRGFTGHFLYVNMPPADGVTWLFNDLRGCAVISTVRDKYVIAKIYDCRIRSVFQLPTLP